MEIKIHQPPYLESIPETDKVIFLAGPIQGAPDWQAEVIDIFRSLPLSVPTLRFANPRRGGLDEDFNYRIQTRWERKHLFRSMKLGASLFWLACKDESLPYKTGRAYGQTTRFEMAMAYTRALTDKSVHISFGMEEGYKGSEKYYLDLADELSLPVHSSLEMVTLDAYRHIDTS